MYITACLIEMVPFNQKDKFCSVALGKARFTGVTPDLQQCNRAVFGSVCWCTQLFASPTTEMQPPLGWKTAAALHPSVRQNTLQQEVTKMLHPAESAGRF